MSILDTCRLKFGHNLLAVHLSLPLPHPFVLPVSDLLEPCLPVHSSQGNPTDFAISHFSSSNTMYAFTFSESYRKFDLNTLLMNNQLRFRILQTRSESKVEVWKEVVG